MNEKLQERCKRQIENERSLRQMSTMDSEESIKLASLLYTALGLTADDDKIYSCRRILDSKTGFFANLRGVVQSLLLLKMSIMEDPEDYIDNVIATYDKLTEKNGLSGLFSILTAVIIYEQHGDKDVDAVISQVLDMYAEIQEINPNLSRDSDMAYIALMLLSGKIDIRIEEEKKEIFDALKKRIQLSEDAAQATTLVLITSNKPADQKVDDFVSFYEALQKAGHATSAKRCISIYGAFTDLDAVRDEAVSIISENDQFLKSQKGYGAFSVSTDFRRVVAATLALQYYTIDIPTELAPGEFTVSSGISIEALLFIVLMSIIAID